MYIFGRDVLLKIEGYNYRNGEPTDFRDPVTFFVNIVYPNTRPFLNSVSSRVSSLCARHPSAAIDKAHSNTDDQTGFFF
jgi:hypothetical protein